MSSVECLHGARNVSLLIRDLHSKRSIRILLLLSAGKLLWRTLKVRQIENHMNNFNEKHTFWMNVSLSVCLHLCSYLSIILQLKCSIVTNFIVVELQYFFYIEITDFGLSFVKVFLSFGIRIRISYLASSSCLCNDCCCVLYYFNFQNYHLFCSVIEQTHC